MAGILLPQQINGIIFWCMALASLQIVIAGRDVDQRTTLRCHRRIYHIYAEKFDDEGRKCWDIVKIRSCWGRCDSNEISDWQFPYKRSHHPVCVHGGRHWSSTELQHCDSGVTEDFKQYAYLEATNCRCQICSSEDTSCEWLPADMNELVDLFPPSNKVISEQPEDGD